LDIGPIVTSKILKENGQLLTLSMFRGLTPDEMMRRDEEKLRDAFDSKLKKKLGRALKSSDLDEIDFDHITPEYELYDDDFEGTYEPIPDIDDVNPEDEDNYRGAQVNLPYRGTMRSGRVTRRARDVAGESYGVKDDNPILDTRVYQVEFPDG
jgi:hypothetical protein